ncbi:MAG: DUF1559 domain-containing protein [Planctomycetales bacterium]
MTTKNARRGLTLVEFLVVVIVGFVLLGLLIPGIINARESARRSQCKLNLHQIGLALHNYHDQYRLFPPGYVSGAAPPSTANGWGWSAQLLPFMESSPIYSWTNFNLPVDDPSNRRTAEVVSPWYLCPSDAESKSPFPISDLQGTLVMNAGPSSYAAICGDSESRTDVTWANGPFFRNSNTSIQEMRRGSSSTAIIGERAWGMAMGTWVGAPDRGILRAGSSNRWKQSTLPSPAFVLMRSGWINRFTDPAGGLDESSSFHPGGAHLLFGDGSVRFMAAVATDGPEHDLLDAMGRLAGDESDESDP